MFTPMTTMSTQAQTGGQVLRLARLVQGRGLRETGRLAGIDASQLCLVEHDEAGLSVDALARLAKVLGLQDLSRVLGPFTNGMLG